MARVPVVVAAILAVTVLSACSYSVNIDANGFSCTSRSDCPSGYRCEIAEGELSGICCNRPDGGECLSPGTATSLGTATSTGLSVSPDASLDVPTHDVPIFDVPIFAGLPPIPRLDAATGTSPMNQDANPEDDNCKLNVAGKRCRGSTPQVCLDTGLWQDQAPCGEEAPLCSAGACVACPGTGGPVMVALPLGYCIDSTEVTRGQYQAWLKTNPTMDQTSVCTWNDTFTPSQGWPPTTNLNDPVTYLDWCDAYAYCAAVGKRLCGKIGGGSNPFGDYQNAASSEWYAACSSSGINTYPYGTTYSADACNAPEDLTNPGTIHGTVPVGTMTGCQSSVAGYSGVYDLVGNVREWEDSCTGTSGPTDSCRDRGCDYFCPGPKDLPPSTLSQTCGNSAYADRSTIDSRIGFRCCGP